MGNIQRNMKVVLDNPKLLGSGDSLVRLVGVLEIAQRVEFADHLSDGQVIFSASLT